MSAISGMIFTVVGPMLNWSLPPSLTGSPNGRKEKGHAGTSSALLRKVWKQAHTGIWLLIHKWEY